MPVSVVLLAGAAFMVWGWFVLRRQPPPVPWYRLFGMFSCMFFAGIFFTQGIFVIAGVYE